MHIRTTLPFSVVIVLSACSSAVEETPDPTLPGQLPDAVIAIVAPFQDVSTARILPEDGCYWYLHAGPVETTLLPLLAYGGQPICNGKPT